MCAPFNDPVLTRRLQFMWAFLDLDPAQQLVFLRQATDLVNAERNNHLQLLLWQLELADRGITQQDGSARSWHIVDIADGPVRIIE